MLSPFPALVCRNSLVLGLVLGQKHGGMTQLGLKCGPGGFLVGHKTQTAFRVWTKLVLTANLRQLIASPGLLENLTLTLTAA